MTAPVTAPREFDLIQRYLIPPESTAVRYCMKRAFQVSQASNPLAKHLFPLLFAIEAIAFSFFNTLLYLIQIPFITLLDAVRLAPLRLLIDPLEGVANTARSALFASLGPSLLIAGLVFPEAVYASFAPNAIKTENDQLKEQLIELEKTLKDKLLTIDEQAATIESQQFTINNQATMIEELLASAEKSPPIEDLVEPSALSRRAYLLSKIKGMFALGKMVDLSKASTSLQRFLARFLPWKKD